MSRPPTYSLKIAEQLKGGPADITTLEQTTGLSRHAIANSLGYLCRKGEVKALPKKPRGKIYALAASVPVITAAALAPSIPPPARPPPEPLERAGPCISRQLKW